MSYKSLNDIVIALSDGLRPPERLTVSEAAEKYVYLNNPGSYIGPYVNSSAWYMVEPMNELASRDKDALIFVGPAQSGKPIALDTPIATPSGWDVFGNITVGDKVFSIDGTVCTVIHETEVYHDRKCYRITFDDGSSVVCDEVHPWSVNDTWAKDPYTLVVKETSELYEKYKITTANGKHRYRYSIPNAEPLDLPQRELPIEPYLLGLWLGDGDSTLGYLNLNLKDGQEIVNQLQKRGHVCEVLPSAANRRGTIVRVKVHGLLEKLIREKLVCRKSIPNEYLRASESQRRDLLKGLLDTDGTVTKRGQVEVALSNRGLYEGLQELIHTLGYKTNVNARIPKYTYKGVLKEGRVSYKITFQPDQGEDVFTLNRHIHRIEEYRFSVKTRDSYTSRRFIRKIEPVDSVPVKCIGVDHPTHLFLVGEQMVPTHNTQSLLLNWLAYSVVVDPMDMILYSPTSRAARDFSIRRVDRLHRHSKDVGKRLLKKRDSDNTFDKKYDNGMLLSLSHPSVTEFAGRPIARVGLTDYDRMPDDIGGDGSPFDLASKRTTTFGSFAMTMAESSPSRPITDPKYIPQGKHEAPPTTGILALYNRGDRRRRYWPCPNCDEYFEARFSMFEWDNSLPNKVDKAESVRLVCPNCDYRIHPDQRNEMDMWGIWLKEGQWIDSKGKVHGEEPRNNIASFWLNGVAAAFTTWRKLVLSYLNAEEEYERTGSQESLKKFYNTDLGEPYYPKGLDSERLPEVLKSRAEDFPVEWLESDEPGVTRLVQDNYDALIPMVPEGVRFLVAAVDVQNNMFVVQVYGIMPGEPFDLVLFDRFHIVKSSREDVDGERLWVRPASYLEDWDLLTEHILERSYPLSDGSGRRMMVKMTVCDSGGREGVTGMAYNYYRKLRKLGLSGRFHLVKGDSVTGAPRARISYPDSNRRDKLAVARGDVPVLLLNSNTLKDMLSGRLDCVEPGKGMFRIANWLPDFVFSELCAEVRTAKGWENPQNLRNEAWDLSYYAIGVCVSSLLRIESMDWDNPQGWASEWDSNVMITASGDNVRFAKQQNEVYDFAKLASNLA